MRCALCLREGHKYADCLSLGPLNDLKRALIKQDDGLLDIDQGPRRTTIRALKPNGQWDATKTGLQRLGALRDGLKEDGISGKLMQGGSGTDLKLVIELR